MAIFDDPNWLRGINSPPMVQPNDPGPLSGGPMPSLPQMNPVVREKRTIGNVLKDVFSGSRIAQNMRDPGLAAWGDMLSNIARISRGEDPTSAQMDRAFGLQQWDQQQEELNRAEQARTALGDLLMGAEGAEQVLAQNDPETLMNFQSQQAQNDLRQKQMELNMGRPIPLGGGGFLTRGEDGEWIVHEGPEQLKWVTTGEGQTGVLNQETGRFQPVGGRKQGNNRVVTVQGPDGPVLQMIDAQGNPVRTIGAAPPKGAAASTGGASTGGANDVLRILQDNNITLTGPDPVDELIKGSTSGWVENIGATAAGVLGRTTPGQENIGKLETIDNSIVLALAGGKLGAGVSNADRDFFKQMSGLISDATIPVGKRRAAWKQVRARLRSIAEREGGASAPQAAGPNEAALAEARRRGLIR